MSKKKNSIHRSKREERLFENLLKTTYEFIKGRHYAPQTLRSLVERLNIHPDHLDIFEGVLQSLKQEGKIHLVGETYHHMTQPQEIVLAKGETIVRGTISVHPRGFGFVNQPSPHEDIFIPKTMINGAVDGDTVDIATNLTAFSEKGPDGRVVAVVERKRRQIIGTVVECKGKKASIYSALLGEMHPIECHLNSTDTVKIGDRVVLDVTQWGQKKEPTTCSLSRILGNVKDTRVDLPFVILESGVRHEFSQDIIDEAKRFGTRVKPSDIKGRVDLRDLECVTIDPDTAKDFDDAISLELVGNAYRVGVHIADVSHYVRPKSALDIEASLRCNSTYFPNTCIPMLPKELSENLCSLKPNVARLTVSVFFNITESGETSGWEIVRSVIKSKKRFTYKQAKAILDGKVKSAHAQLLKNMVHVCQFLKSRRSERGSVQLYVPELIVKVDENGKPLGMELVEYDITHQMVEEFMLKANEIVAIHLGRHGKDVTYRVHEEPAEESLKDFSTLVSAFGFHLPPVPSPYDIQGFFKEIEGSPHASYLAICYIKSMRLACYSPDNIGHYGLSLEHYCHFTSPIRRYIDVIIHRLLFEDGPDKETLAKICQDASEKERISSRAEGSLITIKKLRFLEQERKKAPKREYKAIITTVKPFGIFFDIVDVMIEGFLHVSELEDDYFLFDDSLSQLCGRNSGITYHSGDHIIVMCDKVDIMMQEASWKMVGRDEAILPLAKAIVRHPKAKKKKTSQRSHS
jgi:ribonuclease R